MLNCKPNCNKRAQNSHRGDSAGHAAFYAVAAEPDLHRDYARQEIARARWAEEASVDCGSQGQDPAAVLWAPCEFEDVTVGMGAAASPPSELTWFL